MADGLMKNIVKKTIRTKESLRETFGKVDRTTDDQFEESIVQFNAQQKNADHLQRELKNYVACLRALSQASKSFNDAIREVYEPHWDGVEHIKATSHSLDLVWDEYLKSINDDALQPLNYYSSQFNDLKVKIAKRGRKLVDFDAARHNFNSVQASSKKDDAKMGKSKEQMNIAKKLYDDLNNELLIALPGLYDSRVSLIISLLKTVFKAEESFHGDNHKLDKDMLEDLEKMKVDSYNMERPVLEKSPSTVDCNGKSNVTESQSKFYTDTKQTENEVQRASLYPQLSKAPQQTEDSISNKSAGKNPFDETTPASEKVSNPSTVTQRESTTVTQEELATITQPSPTVNQPSTVILFKVRATHRYTADDTDELSFEAGELITVVPCELPDDQDEGWLTGIKESNGQRGVFPENFTKRI